MVQDAQSPWAQLPPEVGGGTYADVADLCVTTSLGFAAPFALVALVLLRFRRGRWRTDLMLTALVYLAVFGINLRRCQHAMELTDFERTLRVTARDGHWWFVHPERDEPMRDEGWLVVGQKVQFLFVNETSATVGASLPAFRLMREVPPGRAQQSWCVPTEPGDVHLFAAKGDDAEVPAADRPAAAVLHVVAADELVRAMANGR
ncbi:MAG: hypothetical protein R3F29_12995 [Planctomycetota bacterium]